MAENMVNGLINALSAVIAVEYMDHGFPKRYQGTRRWLLSAAGSASYFLVVTALNHYTVFEGILGLCYAVVLVLYGLTALKGRPHMIVLLGMAWVLIIIINAYMVFAIMGIMTGRHLKEFLASGGIIWTYSALAALVLKFAMGRVVLALYRRKDNAGQAEDGIMAGTFLLLFVMVLGMFRLEGCGLNQRGRYYLSLYLLGGFIGLVLLLGRVYRQMGKYYREKQEVEYRKERWREQEEQVLNLFRIGREVNHLRHDMNGKLDVLCRLAEKGRYGELLGYIKEMDAELGKYPELPQDTGNEGVNAMLMKAVPECSEKGIGFRYVVLGHIDDMDSMDMGNLLNNLLSNAVEAAEKKEGDKEVELIIRREGEAIEIELANSTSGSVLEKNPGLQSQKKEPELHGFGMASINRIIETYQGEYSYWEEANCFFQKIILTIIPK